MHCSALGMLLLVYAIPMVVDLAREGKVAARGSGMRRWPPSLFGGAGDSHGGVGVQQFTMDSAVHLQRGNEGLLRDIDLAELPHLLLAFLLLLQKLALARDVA